jgi:hypothetical protein
VWFDASNSLERTRNQRILVQGSMRSEIIIIIGITFQNSAQMRLAQDNDVVHTFTPDRSDQPFGESILPGRRWCNALIAYAHGPPSACDDAAIDPVATRIM